MKPEMKALLFDLDGVIVDTAEFHFLAWKQASEKLGFDLTRAHNEKLKGISRSDSLKRILEWAGIGVSDEEFERIMYTKNQHYLALVNGMTEEDILPGVKDFIGVSRASGYLLAVGSASKNAPIILQKIGLEDDFDAVVDGNTVARAKPHPEVFTRAAELLGVPYERCVVFEDSEAGIDAANAVGMTSIGIGAAEALSQAQWVFPGFENLSIEFINQLTK